MTRITFTVSIDTDRPADVIAKFREVGFNNIADQIEKAIFGSMKGVVFVWPSEDWEIINDSIPTFTE